MVEHRRIVEICYLSGPMENLTFDEMNTWREDAESYFRKHDIDVVNPVRCPTQINEKIIVRGDKRSVDLCDCLLVNLEHLDFKRIKPKVLDKLEDFKKNNWIDPKDMANQLIELFSNNHVKGFGTIMEIEYAYSHSKPIVAVISKNWDPAKIPVWLAYHIDFVTQDMQEALKYIVSLNNRRIRPQVPILGEVKK